MSFTIRPEQTADAPAFAEVVEVAFGSPVEARLGPLGFEHSVPHGIHISLPSWAPSEAAQMIRLRAYDPRIRGHVVSPAAFDEAIGH